MSQRADSSTELSDKNNSFTAGRCFDSLPNGAGFIIFKGWTLGYSGWNSAQKSSLSALKSLKFNGT